MGKKRNKNRFVLLSIVLLVVIFYNITGYSQSVVDRIYFEGNTKTKSSYLQRFIHSKTGEIPDSQKIAEDLRKLSNLAPVMEAKALLTSSGSGLSLIYSINERYTLLPVGDFGISHNNFWIGGGLMESNLGGKGLYAYGYYQYNLRHTVHLIFRNPYVFASPWGFEFQLRNTPGIEYDENNIQILNRFFDLGIAVRYEFRYENDITAGTSFRRQSAENACFSDGDPIIDLDRSAQVFYLRHELQKLSCRYFYVKGWKNRIYFSVQFPYIESNTKIVSMYDELKIFVRTSRRGNMALRLTAGISNEKIKTFYPFLADSYISFRGIGYHAFRGNIIGLINAEYRITCFENPYSGIQLVAFSDAGYVTRLSYHTIENRARSAQLFPGLGVRFIYKKAYNAILTIDYGFDVLHREKGGLVVGWGQYF